MRAVVLAYHDIGCRGIEALIRHGFEIAAVFTHRDDPHENVWFGSVAEAAARYSLPVFAPEDINHPLWVEKISELKPDFLFSFYYRNLVKAPLLAVPKLGCLNLHGSLLPKYRGRCPANWVLVNGERETGVTLHYMTPRPDDGDIVAQERVAIVEEDTARTLMGKLTVSAGKLLEGVLPLLKAGKAPRLSQDHSKATYFGGRRPADGEISWAKSAREIRNLVRAVARPYPGAFSFLGNKKVYIWQAAEISPTHEKVAPGTVLAVDPLVVAAGTGALQIEFGQTEQSLYLSGVQLARELNLVKGHRFGSRASVRAQALRKQSVLILGANGFIGNALSERLLASGRYEVHGLDLRSDYLTRLLGRPDFHFFEGDIAVHREWIEYHIKKCDIVLPLVAIATPIEYTRNPLRVFELDFEENLRIVRYCHKYKKRIVFPSTSEVYGMCDEEVFDEDDSRLVLGPIRMQRWIYACSKQLLDRVIWAYGDQHGLQFTLFRPFNWIGPRLDSLNSARIGSSRAITQLILNLVEGTPILLIDGGQQKRCFTDLEDGVEALFRIVENREGRCTGKIINIGNPDNEASVREQAELLLQKFEAHPLRSKFPPFAGFKVVESSVYYGCGYQDVQHRRPSILNAKRYLDWTPRIGLEESIDRTLNYFLQEAIASGDFNLAD